MGTTAHVLVVATGGRRSAIPIAHVRETMRPRPVDQLAGAPPFVRGLAVIRGLPVPVLDLGALLDGGRARDDHARFVTVVVGARVVALAVDVVIGVAQLDLAALEQLPSLLGPGDHHPVEGLALLEAQLVTVLRAARVLSDDAWAAIDRERP